jgi:hypothetical protein
VLRHHFWYSGFERYHQQRAQHASRGLQSSARLRVEFLTTLCLAGIAAEEMFCEPITDGGDEPDLRMAREHLSRAISNSLQAAAELARCRDAAQRLVRSAWATRHIRLLAGALMQRGTLTDEEIFGCVLAPPA